MAINANVFEALHILQEEEPSREKDPFLFTGKRGTEEHLSRSQAFRIIKETANMPGWTNISAVIPCAKPLAITHGNKVFSQPC